MEQKHVVFRLENESYSMDIEYVRAIEQNYTIIPLPNAPEHVKGMINLRGEIIPVYSLRSKFNLEEIEKTSLTQLLIAKSGKVQLAFEVDQVMEIATINESNHKEIPIFLRGGETNYIGGILNVKGKIIVEISISNIMSESEWDDIEEVMQQALDQ